MVKKSDFDIGVIGLGVMGRNLVLNIADHGHSAAGYDKNQGKGDALRLEAGDREVYAAESLEEFVRMLRRPRAVILLVPAGPPVDAFLGGLTALLERGDLIIDGGNSHYKDTDLRSKKLAEIGVELIGMGISGGEEGARHGACFMPGGPREAWERVRPIIEDAAAQVDGEPCAAWMGPGSAGHYVKMVHNGIEYGVMELIAETYDLMKRGLGYNDDRLQAVFSEWSRGELNAYLIEITAQIFCQTDPKTSRRLIEVILDAARQKGTGKWTVQDAMDLRVPVPTIAEAVAMRDLSDYKVERMEAAQVLVGDSLGLQVDRDLFLIQLEAALYAAMLITFAQGMALLREASQAYDYGIQLEEVARIWRGGCIIRWGALESMRNAFQEEPDLQSLLLDPHLAGEVAHRMAELRVVTQVVAGAGIPAPAFMSALAYYDGYRSEWLPANLIQAQRDFFGAHTYERVDERGTFHTHWGEEECG